MNRFRRDLEGTRKSRFRVVVAAKPRIVGTVHLKEPVNLALAAVLAPPGTTDTDRMP